jgi:hypothetical protein
MKQAARKPAVQLRPSTIAAAKTGDDGEKKPLKLKYPEPVRRAMHAHAAAKGMTVADWLLGLAKADGLRILEGE